MVYTRGQKSQKSTRTFADMSKTYVNIQYSNINMKVRQPETSTEFTLTTFTFTRSIVVHLVSIGKYWCAVCVQLCAVVCKCVLLCAIVCSCVKLCAVCVQLCAVCVQLCAVCVQFHTTTYKQYTTAHTQHTNSTQLHTAAQKQHTIAHNCTQTAHQYLPIKTRCTTVNVVKYKYDTRITSQWTRSCIQSWTSNKLLYKHTCCFSKIGITQETTGAIFIWHTRVFKLAVWDFCRTRQYWKGHAKTVTICSGCKETKVE